MFEVFRFLNAGRGIVIEFFAFGFRRRRGVNKVDIILMPNFSFAFAVECGLFFELSLITGGFFFQFFLLFAEKVSQIS